MADVAAVDATRTTTKVDRMPARVNFIFVLL
jgi:hypothetical protein